jgi:hypothetical protein
MRTPRSVRYASHHLTPSHLSRSVLVPRSLAILQLIRRKLIIGMGPSGGIQKSIAQARVRTMVIVTVTKRLTIPSTVSMELKCDMDLYE